MSFENLNTPKFSKVEFYFLVFLRQYVISESILPCCEYYASLGTLVWKVVLNDGDV